MEKDKFFITPETRCGECPECGTSWDGGDIFENLKKDEFYKGKTDDEIKISASQYGWSEENKIRSSKLIGIELPWDHPDHIEGISFWQCPECEVIWNRLTGEKTKNFASYVTKKVSKDKKE